MTDSIRDLLVRGVAAAKAKEKKEARFFLEWAIRLDPSEDQLIEAWYWMSEVSDDLAEKRHCLEEVLARQPSHYPARRSLAVLEGRLNPQEIINPDRIPTPTDQSHEPVQAQLFICPQCGGRLTYTPDGGSLTCEYCNQNQTLATQDSALKPDGGEKDFTIALATARGHTRPVAVRSFECRTCGAGFLLSPQALSVTCPYCAAVYAVETNETRSLIPPESLIPFAVTKPAAIHLLKEWFTFRKIMTASQKVSLNGVYLPVWKFTISGHLPWEGSEYSGGEWKSTTGHQLVFFDDLVVLAANTLPEIWSAEINCFNYDRAVPYEPAYLADWPAETYQNSLSDASLKARWQALDRVRKMINHELTRPVKDLKINSMDLLIQSFQLILVPVWIAHLSGQQRRCSLLINGQTGDVRGETPSSEKRGVIAWLLE